MNHFRTLPVIFLLSFLLGSYKGYLALWKDNRPEPCQIFPIAVDSLPEADQCALAQGIRAHSRRQLDQLLEDYLS